jgi:hypothetical protein
LKKIIRDEINWFYALEKIIRDEINWFYALEKIIGMKSTGFMLWKN